MGHLDGSEILEYFPKTQSQHYCVLFFIQEKIKINRVKRKRDIRLTIFDIRLNAKY